MSHPHPLLAGGAPVPDILAGPGEVRALLRAHPWAKTALGRPDAWPQSLKAIVRVMLTSRFAMWMAWGPDLTFFCNDAYLPTVGIKRDWVIGARSDQVWAEIWSDIGPRIEHVLRTGEATWDEALRLYLERSGFAEETYHTFSYSPLADDEGRTSGMLCVVAEVTERIFGERQLASLRDLGERLAGAATRSDVMRALEQCLAGDTRDLPFAAAYLRDPAHGGDAMRVALHGLPLDSPMLPGRIGLDDPAAPWPFRLVCDRGASDLCLVPGTGTGTGAGAASPTQALVVPINAAEGEAPAGFLVAGLNPHRHIDASYKGFIGLLAGQVSAAVARADEFDRERARGEALAEIDRAKTAFFSNVSHEFRTPLTLMLGPLEDALGDADGLSAEQRERLALVHRNALRLMRLVNSLLDFARIEAARTEASFRPTDLSSLTADLASSFRSATDRAGLRLVVDTPPLRLPVHVDRGMWETIVFNLLSNAFKFTFTGEIAVTLREEGGRVLLRVRDTGTGIPASELPKLFERFHRIEGAKGRSFEGSGIGLALVHELVKQHGGDVSVESEVGRGTTFTVCLSFGTAHLAAERIAAPEPLAAISTHARAFIEEARRWVPDDVVGDVLPDAGAPEPAPTPAADGGRPFILLADDNADLRGYIARLLAGRGYEVAAVADGEAALAALRARRPDLLITDVMMPRLGGFELLRTIRADPLLRDLSVIMLSARAGEEATVEGLDAGADDYLTKPFSARELLARVATNITMTRLRRDAAAAIQASEARARELAERVQLALDAGAIIGTWVWDIPGDSLVGDERFATSFGLDRDQCQRGLPFAAIATSIHEEDRARVEHTIAEALAKGGPYRCEYRVRRHDGIFRWIEANGRVELDDNGTAKRLPGVLIDVEHRRAVEAALRDMNEELERRVSKAVAEREQVADALRQAQKMEAVGQLTGGVAHDFNNLLTVIGGNLELARRGIAQGEPARVDRALDQAQKGVERAASLTQRLLAFSRRQPLAPRPIDVDRLVAGIGDLLQRALGETIRLTVDAAPGLWKVDVDPNQLESAILNLVVNARDAMPEGGRLTIAITNLTETSDRTVADEIGGEFVVIAVSDTGLGMPKEVVARAFDPFFTTKEVGKGTGLGLSMVYGFVTQSGGKVDIASRPGHGTTVRLYLPRFVGDDLAEAVPIAAGIGGPIRGHRVLVVEDDEDVRLYTVESLRELGYDVMEAEDGYAALRRLAQHTGPIDLLLTDVVMPGMSGRELADRVRTTHPEIEVLYTTGYARDAIVHHGRLDAGVEMLGKPFSFKELADKLAEVLAASRARPRGGAAS